MSRRPTSIRAILGGGLIRVSERARVRFDHLIIEVNESVYVGRRDKVVECEIAALRKNNLRVALDDSVLGIRRSQIC